MLSVYRLGACHGFCVFGSDEICVIIKKEPRSSFVCMCGSARGCANPPAGQRLWSFITRCTEECVGRQHSRLFSPQTAFCASNTPVRDKSHNAEQFSLGGENFLRWAINQQLVISTSYSRLASYKWGNSCRQEPQGKQDVKISDGRLDSFSRFQHVRVCESSEITESAGAPKGPSSFIVMDGAWQVVNINYNCMYCCGSQWYYKAIPIRSLPDLQLHSIC